MTAPLASENDLRNAFVAAVPFHFPDWLAFVRQILNVEARGGWRAKAGVRGQADIYMIGRGGRHIEVECKAAKGRWREAQLAWRARCAPLAIPDLVRKVGPGEQPARPQARWVEEFRPLA